MSGCGVTSQNKTADWFFKELLLCRLSWLAVFNVKLFILLSIVSSVLFEISPLHPLTFLSNVVSQFSIQNALIVICMSTACFPALFASYKVISCYPGRFKIKVDLPWIVLYWSTHLTADLIFLFAVIKNVNWTSANSEARKVAYYSTLLCSVYLSFEYFRKKDYVLKFPGYVIPKLNHFGLELFKISQGIWSDLWKICSIFLFSYVLLGQYLVHSLAGDVSTEPRQKTWFGIYDAVLIFWSSLICVFIGMFRRKVSNTLLNMWICQPYEFDIPSPDAHQFDKQENSFTPDITEAMACENVTLLQYMAFWDFCRLTKLSRPRLHRIFLISRPGGHPRPWNAVRDQCMRRLDTFRSTLTDLNSKLARSWDATFSQHRAHGTTVPPGLISKVDFSDQAAKSVNSAPLPSSPRGLDQLLAKTDVFVHFQLYAWIIEALSNIVCSAFTEDKLGIVQRDLPQLIATLCDLYSQLERFGRLSTTQYVDESKRRYIDSCRSVLKCELSKAFRCIKAVYGKSLEAVEIKDDNRKILDTIN